MVSKHNRLKPPTCADPHPLFPFLWLAPISAESVAAPWHPENYPVELTGLTDSSANGKSYITDLLLYSLIETLLLPHNQTLWKMLGSSGARGSKMGERRQGECRVKKREVD